MMIKKNTFVRIKKVVMEPKDRSENLPQDTKKTPLVMWTKGFLIEDSQLGDFVEVKTLSGRTSSGYFVDYNHSYKVNYGKFVPQLIQIGIDVRKELDND